MNIFIFLLIIALVAALFYFVGFKPRGSFLNETISEGTSVKVVFPSDADTSLIRIGNMESIIAENCISDDLEETQINLSCPVECPECEESSAEACPLCVCETETTPVVYYQCLDGTLEKNKSRCNKLPLGLKTEDYTINNGILLALNNIEYELLEEGEYKGAINLINISIYNAAGYDIKPKLRIYLYETWEDDEVFKKVIDFSIIPSGADSNSGITWPEKTYMLFLKKQETMKLELLDVAEDEDEVIVELTVELDYS